MAEIISESQSGSLKTVAMLILITLFAAAAAVSLGGALGYWAVGLSFAGAFFLAACGIFILLLRRDRQDMAADSDLVQAILQGARRPTAITDYRGVLRTCNNGWRALFGGRSVGPDGIIADDFNVKNIAARVRREEHVSQDFSQSNIGPLELDVTAHKRFLLWHAVPAADTSDYLEQFVSGEECRRFGLLADLGIGVAVTDRAGTVRYVNRALTDWHGDGDGNQPLHIVPDLLDNEMRSLKIIGEGTVIAVKTLVLPLIEPVRDEPAGHIYFICKRGWDGNGDDNGAAFLDALSKEAPIAVATVDISLDLVDWNKRFARLMDDADVVRGSGIVSFVHREDAPSLKAALRSAFEAKDQIRPLEVRIGVDGAHTCQVYLNLLEQSDPPIAVLYFIDTTERKSLQQQFVQAQKMQAVGQLAGGVAHDFNNLLTAIIGYCDLLLVRHTAGDDSFSDIMQIKQNANRAANLVRQLLAFSRQQTLRPKVLQITDVLAELSNLLRRLIGERIELKMVHGRNLGAVKVDEGQLEQVIINLAVNARDAMGEGGVLTISTRQIGPGDPAFDRHKMMPPDDYVLVEVQDTGSGIAKEHQDKIFDPFFTTKEVGKGTGLGLSTVYGIVKQTGGFIFADSVPGQGATFRLYLPVHLEAKGEPRKKDEPPVRDLTGKGTVLIVEDEDPVRMFASRALANKGYTVLDAESGEKGLELVSSHEGNIDLLITDVVMPNMDGPALVKEVRRSQPDLRIIFISGYTEDVFRETVGNEEFAFLPKPFTLKQLAEKVKEVMA